MTLALPACSNAGFPMVAAAGGCTAIGLQLGLQALFDRSSDPIFSKAAGVTAHSVIAALFCIFVTVFGCTGWFQPPAALVATAATRVLTPVDSVRWLAAFGFGEARRVRAAAFGFGEARRFRVGVGFWCKPDAEGMPQRPTS